MREAIQSRFPCRSVDILGVRIDDVTMADAIAIAHACLISGQSHQIVTPNAEFVMRAQRDRDFRQILNAAALSIPDGAGLLLAGRILGTTLREQVTGTDLSDALAALCAAKGYRLFLLGGAPGIAESAADRLIARHPGLVVAGAFAGRADPTGDAEVENALRKAAPVDVLLVAYGAPAQERWIQRNQARLGIPLAMGVGGVFDFLSGRVPRAPRLMRRLGFDWLYRLIRQPWRWRRQLALPQFVIAVAARRLFLR